MTVSANLYCRGCGCRLELMEIGQEYCSACTAIPWVSPETDRGIRDYYERHAHDDTGD